MISTITKGCQHHFAGSFIQKVSFEVFPMRLDKYLKVSRLIKRRTTANEACDNGLVSVNGRPARASYEVKAGDRISLRLGAREVTVEVLSVQETVRQADAAALYRQV